jgi:alkylhydroperoxidase family enzyme
MTTQKNSHSRRHAPKTRTDISKISAHVTAANRTRCERCASNISRLTGDIADLLAEIADVYNTLADTRMEAANLRAAMQATLSADREGEDDPLAYLRYELGDNAEGGDIR